MQGRFFFQWFVLISLFIIALVMEIAPWPAGFQGFKPAWLVLTLLYWVLAVPRKVNIGCAFTLGLVWDLVLGSTLGIHALVVSVFTYFIALNHQLIRNLSLWLQSLLVILFIFAVRSGVFLIELLLNDPQFHSQEIFGAIISGILWPWLFLLLRKIRHQIGLK